MSDDMGPVPQEDSKSYALESAHATERVRARRRVGTIALVYLVHLIIAVAIAWPTASLLASGTQHLALADSALFEPGGLYLLEAVRFNSQSLVRVVPGALWIVLVSSYLGLLPLAALIHALNRSGGPTVAELAWSAGRYFGRFSVLLGVFWVAVVFCSGIVGLTALAIPREHGAGQFGAIAVVAAGALFVAVLRVLHDIARAAVVRGRLDAIRAVEAAWKVLVRWPLRSLLGWAWRAGLGLALIAAVAFLVEHIPASTRLYLLAVFALHQFVAAMLIALRASWLANALRIVARHRAECQRPQ